MWGKCNESPAFPLSRKRATRAAFPVHDLARSVDRRLPWLGGLAAVALTSLNTGPVSGYFCAPGQRSSIYVMQVAITWLLAGQREKATPSSAGQKKL